ncbi:MAG: biopolymer transporter ExbD [Planctomycetota bacterium]|jgi:biopolymer transport protein ExbD
MRVPNYPGSRGVSINLTPMIDVTFLLIIFFLVSSHLAKQENFLPLELPVAGSGISDFSDRTTLTIQIPSDGSYLVNNASVPLDQMQNLILVKMEENGKNPIRIRIRTDKSATYAPIAKLLKLCAVTGNSDIVFAVYEEDR